MFLEYVIEATEDVLSFMILWGVMFAHAGHAYSNVSRKIFRYSFIGGVAAAVWMAYLKNASNVRTSALNLRLYYVSFIAVAAFIVFTIVETIFSRKHKKMTVSVACIAMSVYAIMLLLIYTPDFFAYPYTLMVAETTAFSSSYILKLSGVVVGFVLTLVAALAANRMGRRLGYGLCLAFLLVLTGIHQMKMLGSLLGSMLSNRIISMNANVFKLSVFLQNRGNLYIFLTLIASCAAAIVMLVRSGHVNEPYSNPAQHRKIRAKWRLIRKWACTSLITAALAVVLLTAVDSVVNAAAEIAPTEDPVIEDGNAIVDLSLVNDGHLHRFGYTTENNIEVRYIIIQKPNSSAYGIGMDCCDICGETGYYENKAGDIVCSRCNVIMNINTIGYKGGCNPKIIEYTIEDGKVVVPLEQLTQYEDDFKSGRGSGASS